MNDTKKLLLFFSDVIIICESFLKHLLEIQTEVIID